MMARPIARASCSSRHAKRRSACGWSISRLRFASDGIVSFSALPLRIATLLGILAGLVALGVAVWVLAVVLTGVQALPGWATLMFAV
ncbi:MAG: hypothetical protein RL685_219, partial [Pseudomonadota bacterium]